MFNISCHVHIITSKQVYYKIGHIHGIEQNVEVWMQYAHYFIDKSIDHET